MGAARTARAIWLAGAATGIIGGAAVLTINPIAVAAEVLVVGAMTVIDRRVLAIAGALAGHGLAWSWLLLTSSVACTSRCWYSLPYGPAHLEDANAWQTETRLWLLAAVLVFATGVLLTVTTARRRAPQS